MRRIGYRHQRTLAGPAEVSGPGLVTGRAATAVFRPAPADAGVVFVRADLPGRPATRAAADAVTGTARRTTLGPAATGVTLVEHVLAALAGLRVDNCVVELDGPEPPGLDGSALGFADAVRAAGAVLQAGRREVWAATAPVVVSRAGATVGLHPPAPGDRPGLTASYVLDYGVGAPIPRQAVTLDVAPETFAREVAGARTFVLEAEADALRRAGVGAHLTPADVLVFGPRGPVANRLRAADEPARHKVLDLVGDLAVCGFDLAGHLVAYRSGHALNAALAAALAARVQAARPAPRPAARRLLAA